MLEAHATRRGAGRLVRSKSRRADSNRGPLHYEWAAGVSADLGLPGSRPFTSVLPPLTFGRSRWVGLPPRCPANEAKGLRRRFARCKYGDDDGASDAPCSRTRIGHASLIRRRATLARSLEYRRLKFGLKPTRSSRARAFRLSPLPCRHDVASPTVVRALAQTMLLAASSCASASTARSAARLGRVASLPLVKCSDDGPLAAASKGGFSSFFVHPYDGNDNDTPYVYVPAGDRGAI